MRATIERDTTGGATDPYGNPVEPVYAVAYNDVPCWLTQTAGVEMVAGDRTVVVNDYRLYFPPGTDITELDRVGEVRDRRGVPRLERPMDIRSVIPRIDHKEVVLWTGSSIS